MALSILQRGTQCILGSAATCKVVPAGTTLFLEGQMPNALYQLKSGCIKLSWNSPAGKEVIHELLVPGDVFDLPSCLDGSPYPLAGRALSNCDAEVWSISRGMVLEDPELMSGCQRLMLRQLRDQRSHPVASATERVEVRVIRALLWLSERLGGPRFPLLLTRQELADWVGTTTETVIRILSQFRRRGWIEEQQGWLTLLEVTDLRECSEAA